MSEINQTRAVRAEAQEALDKAQAAYESACAAFTAAGEALDPYAANADDRRAAYAAADSHHRLSCAAVYAALDNLYAIGRRMAAIEES